MSETDETVYPAGDCLSAKDDAPERAEAATNIQRVYRGYRSRRELQGHGLDASTRWIEAVKDAQYQKLTSPTNPHETDGAAVSEGSGKAASSAQAHWHLAGAIARRAGAGTPPLSSSDSSGSEIGMQSSGISDKQRQRHDRAKARNQQLPATKMMDLQYWLELTDKKHRYGSNLRAYHNFWKTQPTKQNFFYWLDYGEGKDLELPSRSRQRLESEQVRYLSKAERQNYLVKVDAQGRLCWAKNGERITTRDDYFRDSMQGIVPKGDKTPKFKSNVPSATESASESDEDSEIDDEEAEHYANEDFHAASGPQKIAHVSPAVIFNHLIRENMKKGNKWIYVADTSFRLFIGMKQPGAFQHSSFLHGARISAAGTLKVKDGQLRSLSPLSGHYRAPTANFQAFVHSLRDAGVDLSRVSTSKSYAVLVGMESYVRTKKKVKTAEKTIAHHTDMVFRPEKAKEDQEKERDKTESAEKERKFLEDQRTRERDVEREKKKDGLVARIRKKFGRIKPSEDPPAGGPESGIPAPGGRR